MSVTFDPFTGPGSTPTRRRFWDDALEAVKASRKLPGINVKVDEYPSGSVISVPDSRAKTQGAGTGACCYDDGTCAVLTEADCTGGWQGLDTTCDPNPCPSRCCLTDGSCADLSSADCATAGGTFIPGGNCADTTCTCCSFSGGHDLFPPFCSQDGACYTGPENCDGTCLGDVVPCDSLWLTDLEYCIHCPENTRTLCCTSSWNPVTCEFTQTDCDCTCPDSAGTTHESQTRWVPCVP